MAGRASQGGYRQMQGMIRTRKNQKKELSGYLFVAPAFIIFLIFVLLPVLITFAYSFFRYDGFNPMQYIGFSNYSRLYLDKIHLQAYMNTFIYIALTLVLEVGVGLTLAALVSARFKGSIFFRTAFFTPVLLPGVVVGMLWTFVYNQRFGLLNALLKAIKLESLAISWLSNEKTALIAVSVVSGWIFAGYYMTIFYAAIQRIPKDLYDAADIDGASPIRQFLYIKLPLIMDMVVVAVLLCVTGAFQGFDLFYVMTNGQPNHKTEIVTTWLVRIVFNNRDVGYGSAMSVVLTLIVLIMAVVINKARRHTEY